MERCIKMCCPMMLIMRSDWYSMGLGYDMGGHWGYGVYRKGIVIFMGVLAVSDFSILSHT